MARAFKIVLVGSSGVGKSSIVKRLVDNEFCDDASPTTGAGFHTYSCTTATDIIRLQIWDTAGQERFRAISRSYFRNAVGALLVYDITSVTSFDELTDWLTELQGFAMPNAHIILIGNKADLEEKRQVGGDFVAAFAERNHLEVLETSARSGKGVKEAFARLAVEVSNQLAKEQIVGVATGVALPEEGKTARGKKTCC
jgi:small GTP-binding protein